MIVSLEIYDSLFEDRKEKKASETREKDCLRRRRRKSIKKFLAKTSFLETRTAKLIRKISIKVSFPKRY